MQSNMDIRQLALDRGVYFWEIAEKMGIAEGSFSRKLRRELPPSEKQIIRTAIESIASERQR